ncbi:MAG TPA: hypothetical protein DIU15_15355, partial [Deltaproteobacteria bacterium]|nr:hypothetical protein [Deltaproteobacteria bacterium]
MAPRRLSPTAVAKARRCLHTWFLDCHGDATLKVPADEGLKKLWERGLQFERDVLATIPQAIEPQWDGEDWEAGYRATIELMEQGPEWIYQGVLVHERGAGLPDLLQRIERPSSLGDHSYRPVDVKSHKRVSIKDRFQLCTYALFLEPILGYLPDQGAIWLSTQEVADVDLRSDRGVFDGLVERMASIAAGTLETTGLRCGECATCAWTAHCREGWHRDESVCLIAGVTSEIARRLREAGLASWRDVAGSTPQAVARAAGIKKQAARNHWMGARAWLTGGPVLKKPATFPSGVPVHYYDIETYEGCTYLHGVIRVAGDVREEHQFVARDPAQEGEAWRDFLDYLARDEQAVVWVWSNYERGFARSLWRAHGGNEAGYRHLRDSMIDQCQFTKQHFALPSSSYSIKKVAPLFG